MILAALGGTILNTLSRMIRRSRSTLKWIETGTASRMDLYLIMIETESGRFRTGITTMTETLRGRMIWSVFIQTARSFLLATRVTKYSTRGRIEADKFQRRCGSPCFFESQHLLPGSEPI